MTVCRLRVEVCDDGTVLHSDSDIQEVYLVMREFRCEFYGSVERIDVINEGM